jgi:hypothetical protein
MAMKQQQGRLARGVALITGGTSGIGQVEEIIRAVLYLARDDWSFMIGGLLAIDCGNTAGWILPYQPAITQHDKKR